MSKIDEALRDQLEETLKAGISEEAMKAAEKSCRRLVDDIESDLIWRLKDELASQLAGWTADMAEHAVNAMLEGNEQEMRRYLSCEKRGPDGNYIGWTGRSDWPGYAGMRERQPHEWHSVIHGRLFEQGAVELRKKIVDAHRDLLVNERILDLEDQVKSLVAQVNKVIAEKDAMWERFRHVA